MKVLIWVNKFPAISETFIRDHIVGLLKQGLKVSIYQNNQQIDSTQLKALEGFEKYDLLNHLVDIDENFEYSKMKRYMVAVKVLFQVLFSGSLKYYLRALNIFKFGNQAWSLRLFFRVQFIMENNIEIIHCHFGTNGLLATDLKFVGLPVKLFTTFHGFDIRMGLKQGGHLFKPLFESADCLIAISNYNKKHLLNFGASENKIVLLPNGIDPKAFQRQTTNTLKDSTVKLLSVARLVKEKALQVAIKAVAEVQKQTEIKLDYTIIGEGPQKDTLIELTRELGIEKQVHFKGSLASSEVQKAMKSHNVFLLSSKVEVLPTVLLEAQASGMVIVATDVGSVKEIVKAGVVINTSNFTEALLEVINTKNYWDEYTVIGRTLIETYFNADILMGRLIKLYKKTELF